MGINIITSRAGAATSPFIKLLDKLHPAAPFATVGITSLLATLCSLTLPETLNQATRETLDDFDGNYFLFFHDIIDYTGFSNVTFKCVT